MGRIVAAHAPVQAFHDVRERPDVDQIRLFPRLLCERLELAWTFGIRTAASHSGI